MKKEIIKISDQFANIIRTAPTTLLKEILFLTILSISITSSKIPRSKDCSPGYQNSMGSFIFSSISWIRLALTTWTQSLPGILKPTKNILRLSVLAGSSISFYQIALPTSTNDGQTFRWELCYSKSARIRSMPGYFFRRQITTTF